MLFWALRKLRSDHPETRRSAAAELGASANRRAIPALAAALADETEGVRRAAGDALARIDARWAKSPEARAALPVLLEGLATADFDRRRAAARALGEIEGVAAVEPLLDVARRDPRDWTAVHAVAGTLGQLGDARAVKPLLDLLAEAPPRAVRDEMALAVVRLGDPVAAVPLAEGLLETPDTPLAEVVAALEKWADPATIEPLVRAGRRGSRAAVDLLVKLDPGAACELLPCLDGGSRTTTGGKLLRAGRAEALPAVLEGIRNWSVRKDSGEAPRTALAELEGFLEQHAGDTAESLLREAAELKTISSRVEGEARRSSVASAETLDISRARQLARQELSRRDPVASACVAGQWETVVGFGESALPALTSLMHVVELEQRSRLVKAMGRIGGPGVLEPLLVALKDADAATRAAAAHALARCREPSTAPALVVALQDQHKEVRLAAARALAGLGPVVIHPLGSALRNKDHAIRLAAVEILAKQEDPAAMAPLGTAVIDGDGKVRNAALGALRAKGEAAIPALREALNAPDREIVEAVSGALAGLGWKPSEPQEKDRFAIGRHEFGAASSDALAALLDEPRHAHYRSVVLELGRRRENRAVEPLLAMLRANVTGDARAAEAVIAALRGYSDAGVSDALAVALRDRIDALAAALGNRGAGDAIGPLVSLLERMPAAFSEAQLKALAERRTIRVGTGEMICSTGVEETREAECSPRLRQLARQELRRRGIEA